MVLALFGPMFFRRRRWGEAMIQAQVAVEFGDVIGAIEVSAGVGQKELAAGCQVQLAGQFGMDDAFVAGKIGQDTLGELQGVIGRQVRANDDDALRGSAAAALGCAASGLGEGGLVAGIPGFHRHLDVPGEGQGSVEGQRYAVGGGQGDGRAIRGARGEVERRAGDEHLEAFVGGEEGEEIPLGCRPGELAQGDAVMFVAVITTGQSRRRLDGRCETMAGGKGSSNLACGLVGESFLGPGVEQARGQITAIQFHGAVDRVDADGVWLALEDGSGGSAQGELEVEDRAGLQVRDGKAGL